MRDGANVVTSKVVNWVLRVEWTQTVVVIRVQVCHGLFGGNAEVLGSLAVAKSVVAGGSWQLDRMRARLLGLLGTLSRQPFCAKSFALFFFLSTAKVTAAFPFLAPWWFPAVLHTGGQPIRQGICCCRSFHGR